MRLIIIVPDDAVYVDGISYSKLPLAGIPAGVHALQWNTDRGWIEFSWDGFEEKKPNQNIDVLPTWALNALAIWTAARENDFSLVEIPSTQVPLTEKVSE